MKNDVTHSEKPVLSALRGKILPVPPVWLMRQAGRYLPEYRKMREEAGGFLQMVYNPEAAAEVTLQPIRRFGMDGAILFSDILIVPDAFDRDLRFGAGEGPRMKPLTVQDIETLEADLRLDKFVSIAKTVKTCREMLAAEKLDHVTLLGFCGSVWTVACYMIDGKGGEFPLSREWAKTHPEALDRLLEILTEASFIYLSMQIEAGAEVIQLFDSWAGLLDEDGFERFCIKPTAKLVAKLKQHYPHIPVIGFPRGGGEKILKYAEVTGVDALACDTDVPLDLMQKAQKHCCVQGNLDPQILLNGGENLINEVRKIRDALDGGPFIFNLGHGVIKETLPENVGLVIKTVREKL